MNYRKRALLQAESYTSDIPKVKLDNLKEAVREFRERGDFSDRAFRHSKIASVIWDNHKLSVTITPWRVKNKSQHRISIFAPLLSKNNPLILNDERINVSNDDFDTIKFIKKPDIVKGTVNIKEGTVGGIFSDINCKLCLTDTYFTEGVFDDDEISEKITHEVGHLLGYFSCLTDVVTYSYAIMSSLDRILSLDDTEKRIMLVDNIGREMGVDFSTSLVEKAKDKESLYNVMISDAAISRRSETGSSTYANHSWEQLADGLVTRMGGGSALARGIVKYDKLNAGMLLRDPAYNKSAIHYVTEAAKVLFVTVGAVTLPTSWTLSMSVIISILVTGSAGNYSHHEKPGMRLKRIERGIIERLKEKSIPEEERDGLLQQLKIVRGIVENVKDKKSVITFISDLVMGKFWGTGKSDVKAENYMVELEKLNSNELFSLTNQFRNY